MPAHDRDPLADDLDVSLYGTGDTCPFCDGPEYYEILEAWTDPDTGGLRDFQLATCCEGSHDAAVEWLATAPRRDVCAFLTRAGWPGDVRQVYDEHDTGHLRVDCGLTVAAVPFATARAFVARHHRHNKAPVGWRFGCGCFNGGQLVAVVIVGRPVARAIDPTSTVEVTRLCVDPSADSALTWNACSMLYGEAARQARRRGFSRVITYTLETETGTTLRAAGWQPVATTRGGSWNTPSRPRQDNAPTCRKIRWQRDLAPIAAPQARKPLTKNFDQLPLFPLTTQAACV